MIDPALAGNAITAHFIIPFNASSLGRGSPAL